MGLQRHEFSDGGLLLRGEVLGGDQHMGGTYPRVDLSLIYPEMYRPFGEVIHDPRCPFMGELEEALFSIERIELMRSDFRRPFSTKLLPRFKPDRYHPERRMVIAPLSSKDARAFVLPKGVHLTFFVDSEAEIENAHLTLQAKGDKKYRTTDRDRPWVIEEK